MSTLNTMAIDLGASNGRAVVGRFDGEKLTMQEMHRFSNDYVDLNGTLYWDVLRLFMEIKTSLSKYVITQGQTLHGIGIDTWGVDYGLIDKRGQLIANPRSYRMATDDEMNKVFEIIPKRELFERTGIAYMNFNTIFQLYRQKIEGDPALENADKLLMLPDLLGYFLTGEMGSEYTEVSTSMLYNPNTCDWDWEIIKKLGLNDNLFTPIQSSCTVRGQLLNTITTELGTGNIPFIAIGEHDTASAVAAVPATSDSFAFLSSGTWSLFGTETTQPVLSEAVFQSNYSNEGTIQGGFRPLKNIMGLWLIQECKRDWIKQGDNITYDEIVAQAKQAKPFRSIIDPNDQAFFSAGKMEQRIKDFCANTNQPIPETRGEIARCIYESLALKYRWAMERLDEIKGEKLETLHIVGGGIQNKLLNQFAANAINRPVITGPIEGACIGNILGQVMALGEIKDISQMRSVVKNSFDVEEYFPQDTSLWNEAYERLMSYSAD